MPPAFWRSRYRSTTLSGAGSSGSWRTTWREAVGAYLDCGILENGFARVRCGACRAEYLHRRSSG
jgi:hypothetical protein